MIGEQLKSEDILMRLDKVEEVRWKIKAHTYPVDQHLDSVLDTILEDILSHCPPPETQQGKPLESRSGN